jgi:hypothetical protein
VTVITEHYYHDATKFFSASDTYQKNANEILVKAKKEVIEVQEKYNYILDIVGSEYGLKGYKKEILTLDNHVLDLVRKYAFNLDDARVRNEREKLIGYHNLFQKELEYTSIEDVWQVGLDRKSNWRPVTDTYKIRGG